MTKWDELPHKFAINMIVITLAHYPHPFPQVKTIDAITRDRRQRLYDRFCNSKSFGESERGLQRIEVGGKLAYVGKNCDNDGFR